MKRLLLALLLFSLPAWGAPITVAWDPNPPAEEVVAYRVGECTQGVPTCPITVGETYQTQFTFEQALSVSKCYRVLAVNKYGLMSDWSNEVCIQQTKPSVVNNWRVILYVPK